MWLQRLMSSKPAESFVAGLQVRPGFVVMRRSFGQKCDVCLKILLKTRSYRWTRRGIYECKAGCP
ncbi:hypothetical protein AUN02_07530 [Cronobacter sakazakii]|nr:hypothetical protein C5967_16065 [Cronobacter sakazakii]PQX99728.1 hypothetical protein C5963_12760 [Cronobacter sakazakii]PQY43870.1 hypothetical protein C5965_07340 [Cronobacter sakazakii]PQY53474.1 hypothetical protein C5969_14750 [Cronobacter sakazakii]PRC66738.1 hypothetical protein B8W49_04005 [Cronobacter sakazakii]